MDISDGCTLLAEEPVIMYLEDKVCDGYQKAEAVQRILELDMDVNGTKNRVALQSMRRRVDGYLPRARIAFDDEPHAAAAGEAAAAYAPARRRRLAYFCGFLLGRH